jgi:DNA-binding cell septation regulator SpoVG
MDVEARIYLPEKPLENVWGYGEVTVEGLFTFQVRLLNYQKESGEETSFVSFPRRKVQGQWEDVVHPNLELRKKIEEVVNQEIRKEISKDFSHDGLSKYGSFGENIAYGYTSSQAVFQGWMGSAGHRANILRANYGTIGCARYGNYWVQIFSW